jgi:hypothetical protein
MMFAASFHREVTEPKGEGERDVLLFSVSLKWKEGRKSVFFVVVVNHVKHILVKV